MEIYLLIINAAAFLLMLLDKLFAKINHRRIPETTLLAAAIVGGSLGACLGMWMIRHKTRHPKFSIGLPIIMLLHIACLVIFLNKTTFF